MESELPGPQDSFVNQIPHPRTRLTMDQIRLDSQDKLTPPPPGSDGQRDPPPLGHTVNKTPPTGQKCLQPTPLRIISGTALTEDNTEIIVGKLSIKYINNMVQSQLLYGF